jgi:nucleic acid/nucleotide deaminase of polymorphic system toxin
VGHGRSWLAAGCAAGRYGRPGVGDWLSRSIVAGGLGLSLRTRRSMAWSCAAVVGAGVGQAAWRYSWMSPPSTAGRWVPAGRLIPGHKLAAPDGHSEYVVAVHNYIGLKPMRSLTIADFHTYYVVAGNTPVLVHNCLTGNHQVEVNVYDKDGNWKTGFCLRSGCQGDGSNLQSHTENRVSRMFGTVARPALNDDPYYGLAGQFDEGDSVIVEGQNPPCPRCQETMNRLAGDNPGVNVVYTLPTEDGGVGWWQALRRWSFYRPLVW